MNIIDWLKEKLSGKPIPLSGDVYADIEEIAADLCIREMAFWSAVNLIANAVSKCEFKTYMGGKEVKEREYYLWNIEPNKNQNSSAFLHKLVSKLYLKNECLVIGEGSQLLVADDYTRTPYALYDDVFTQVKVGDFTFSKSFYGNEVLYFKLSEQNMTRVLSAMYSSYQRLITYSMKAHMKSRGTKGVYEYETLPVAGTEERRIFDDLIANKFKKFMEAGDAILPLGRGQKFTEIGSKTYSNESTRDIKALIDDVFDFTAKSTGIPPPLLKGDVQGVSDAVDSLLTFCIDPLTDLLAEEINRKRNGYDGFSKGNYLKIDTTTIKHIDLLSVSTAIDKLISSGAFSINDIRRLVGDEPIDDDFADKHFITKNYIEIDKLESLEGRE